MKNVARLIKADHTRKTRFHTSNGYLCINPVEFTGALLSTINRHVFGTLSFRPWLVYSLINDIEPMLSGKRLFEFGSGMSTLWYGQRCREVISVEDNREWYERIKGDKRFSSNISLIFAKTEQDYISTLDQVGGKFDVIVIDGSYREKCVASARKYLLENSIVIVDNTDSSQILDQAVKRIFSDSDIRHYRGWCPGILHANETTLVINIPK